MKDILAGRQTAFLWNWSTFTRGARQVAQLLELGGMTAVAVKSHDGSTWFDQGESFRRIRDRLKLAGVPFVGSWGYHYFSDPAGELHKVSESVSYGRADFHILNVEDPAIERNQRTPAIARDMFGALRGTYPDYPFYFCSHAQPLYHPRQPYYQALEAGMSQMPMAYHTAMQMSPHRSVRTARDGLHMYELDSLPWNAAGALYGVPEMAIRAEDVTAWGRAALEHGASGLTWWDLDVVIDRPDLLEACAQIEMSPAIETTL